MSDSVRPDPNLKVFLDGQIVPVEQAKISVFDHGLLYGDGVFEGIRAYNGVVFQEEAHVRRLYDSAKAIYLEIPMTPEQFKQAIHDTLQANNLKDAYIRACVTRGVGYMGLNPKLTVDPKVFIITTALQMYPEKFYREGLELITASTIRNHPNALSPRIKSMNYLNNIMAQVEAVEAGYLEAVMLNHEGYVAECTGDNIFVVRRGLLQTPPASAGILEGVTRNVVMELARRRGIPVAEPTLTRFDLYTADECFITGTGAEVLPVVKIDGRVIGRGKPGPIFKQLLEDFRAATRGEIDVSV